MRRKQWGNHPPTESGAIRADGRSLRGLRRRAGLGRDVRPTGGLRPGYAALHGAPGRPRRRRPGRAGGAAGPFAAGPGDHLLAVRRGAAHPARPAAPGHRRRGVGRPRGRRHPAGAGPRGLPGRHLRPAGDPGRGGRPPAAHHQLAELPPGGGPPQPAQRRPDPGRRHRHPPGPRRPVRGAGGQPPHAVGHLLRDREPPDHGPGLPRAVLQPPDPPGRRLPSRLLAALRAAAPLRAGRTGRRRADGRRAHARRPQLGLLRALVPGPPDGRRAGRGPRPRLSRQHDPDAHDRRGAPGRRHLPPDRRRLPRPAPVPARLDARLRRHRQRRPGRQRGHRQRRRERRGRRQGRLSLRAGDDPVLPGRAAHPRHRADLPARPRGRAGGGAQPDRRAGLEAGGGVGRLRPRHRAPGRGGDDRPAPRGGHRRPAGVHRPGGVPPLDRSHPLRRPARTPPRRPAALRRQRRAAGLGGAGRAHPGRPAPGQPGGELQPGRRLQGHLGAGRRTTTSPPTARRPGSAAGAGSGRRRRPPPSRARPARSPPNSSNNNSNRRASGESPC